MQERVRKEAFRVGEGGKSAFPGAGRWETEGRDKSWHLCWIRAHFLGSPLQSQAAQIYTTKISGPDPIRSIRAAAALPNGRENISPCLGLEQKQFQMCKCIHADMPV